MKKITFSLFIFLLVSQVTVYAQEQSKSIGSNASSKVFEPTPATLESINQTGFARCLTVENEAILKQKYPERLSSDEFEAWLAPKVEQVKANRATNRTVYNIPVVIHIIHDGDALGTGENITDAQAISQITVMNEDYRKLTGTRGGANTTGAAVDTEINFCLANTDVNGAATTGVVRHVIAPYSNNVANDITTQPDWETTADVESMKTATQWDPTKYLNMWVIRPGGLPLNQGGLSGLLGYAQFPSDSGLNGAPAGGAASTDGVVAGYNAMGTKDLDDGTFILNNSYEYGRTMTHEVGHWLGLRHIWGDGPESGSCGYDDYCDDTPNAEQPNYNCGSVTSCGSADQYQNYMDYSYDTCMDTFTQDQMDRIQTVMTNSPRRMELNSSTACSTSPTIYFESSPSGDLDEGSDCDYIDYTISFALTDGGSANSTVSLIASGTATENEDFELLNNSVTFASGATTASNSITLRIHQDSFVETDETLELSINLSTTGDAEATASTKSITIINDDTAASASGSAVIFEDGFESYTDFDFAPIGDWTMLDVDGNSTFGSNSATWTNTGYTGTFMVFNPSQTTPSLAGTIWDPHTGSKGYYCFDATNNPNGTALNDDYIFTPQMQNFGANGELKLWAKSLTDQYGLERFKVGVSTTDTNPASFTYFTASYAEAPIDWTEYTYDLSAYQGEDIYITIYVESSDAFTFMLDDISVTADVTTVIQETINTATADQLNITGPGEAFAFDATSKNLMLSIDNFGGFAYECTNVNVSRDVATVGAASTMYSANTDPSSFVSAKTFDITTTIQNTADASTLSFYFTEAELAGWESETGNSRTSLYVKKEGTNEVVPVTVTAFGADLELTASFTTGLEGTYVFGVQTALSTTNALTLDTGVSIYPNPSSSALNIKTSDNNLPDTYVIYNMLGQVMSNKTISNNSDLSINTSALSNGMYFIKISKEGNTVSLPFVKK